MKKIHFIALFVSLSLLGCGPKPPSLEDRARQGATPPPGATLTYKGDLEPLQINQFQEGTHKLVTESDGELVLRSSSINLTAYVGKQVVVTGSYQAFPHSPEKVFVVAKLKSAESGGGTEEVYENEKYGFSFSRPADWEVVEVSRGVVVKADSAEVARVEVEDMGQSFGDYLEKREKGEGTPVTVGGVRSARYSDGIGLWIDVPNESRKSVCRLSFSGGSEYEEGFFALVESFWVKSGAVSEGERCGGVDNIACAEGFRCELLDSGDAAEGVCVALETSEAGTDCPFVPKPIGCLKVEPKALGRNGCPASYVCLDEGVGGPSQARPSDDPSSKADSVLSAFQRAQSVLLPSGAAIEQYEWVPVQRLLSVVFELDGGRFKNLYSYQSSESGLEFQKLTSYAEGENRDWVLKDGQEVKIVTDRQMIKVGTEGGQPRAVSADLRLYENTNKHFSIQYPKDWYFKSFGALEGSVWAVGFADKPLDSYSRSMLTLTIESGKGVSEQGAKGDQFEIVVPRDAGTHFRLSGPLGQKEILSRMAETLVAQ